MTTLLLFALLAFLTAVSVLWSIVPELTYIEAGRTFAYLARVRRRGRRRARRPRARLPACSRAPHRRHRAGRLRARLARVARARWPRTRCRTASASPSTTGTPSAAWRRWPCRSRCGSDRAAAAPASRACSPIPPWASAILAILLTQSRGAPPRSRRRDRLVRARAAAAAQPARAAARRWSRRPPSARGRCPRTPSRRASSRSRPRRAVAGEFGGLVLLMLVAAHAGRRCGGGRVRAPGPLRAHAPAGGHRGGGRGVPRAARRRSRRSPSATRGIGDRIDELTSETEVSPEEGGGRVFAASSSRGKYWREAVQRLRRPAARGRRRRRLRDRRGCATARTPR